MALHVILLKFLSLQSNNHNSSPLGELTLGPKAITAADNMDNISRNMPTHLHKCSSNNTVLNNPSIFLVYAMNVVRPPVC